MTVFFWILGLLVAGLLAYVAALVWGWTHVPDGGKSLSQYHQGLRTLHSEPQVTQAIVQALETVPAAFNTPPDVDDEDESFLRHIDENHAVIRIRTEEMCTEELSPEFVIETPSVFYDSVEDDVFDSLEDEIEHYLAGAKAIAEALVEAGLARVHEVTINETKHSL